MTKLPYSVAKQLKQSEVGEEERNELTFGDQIESSVEDSIENDECVAYKILKMSAKKKKGKIQKKSKRGKD